jgi:hypothetical protein
MLPSSKIQRIFDPENRARQPRLYRLYLESTNAAVSTDGGTTRYSWNIRLPTTVTNGKLFIENLALVTNNTGTRGLLKVGLEPFGHPNSFDSTTVGATNIIATTTISPDSVATFQPSFEQFVPLPPYLSGSFIFTLEFTQVGNAPVTITRLGAQFGVVEE